MAKILLANHKGDEVIATYNPNETATVEVAQAKLTAFLKECVERYGNKPPVWARRCGETDFGPFEGDLTRVEEVLLQYPLVGG